MRIGLLEAAREENWYRSFGEDHVRAVAEIRELARIGILPQKGGPFLPCPPDSSRLVANRSS